MYEGKRVVLSLEQKIEYKGERRIRLSKEFQISIYLTIFSQQSKKNIQCLEFKKMLHIIYSPIILALKLLFNTTLFLI